MKQVAREARAAGRLLGLVPTMGALHEGHFSLVRAAHAQCSPIVVSIFVNPRQFGPSEDFSKYPRQLETDRKALESLGVDYLFAPSAAEMYPDAFSTSVLVEGISDRLEGRSRPGHFRGVATVVLKLFEIAQPRFAYFGRKDAQQVRIVRQMAVDLDLDTEIATCPIARESDGLAFASRNAYLKKEERRAATVLYRGLDSVRREIEAGERDSARLLANLQKTIAVEKLASLDYAEIVDAESFEAVPRLRRSCFLLVAAFIGSTRLIDNALIEEQDNSFRISL